MKKGLVKKILSPVTKAVGLGLVGTSLLVSPGQVMAQTKEPIPKEIIFNAYSAPNVHMIRGRKKFDTQGSGDRDNNGIINQDDENNILGSTNYRADTDYDGVPGTASDKLVLSNYLSGQNPFSPGEWNKLSPEAKREKYNKLNNIYVNSTDPDGLICGQETTRRLQYFFGNKYAEENLENFPVEIPMDKIALYDLPQYKVSTTTTKGVAHSVGGILFGDKIREYDGWAFHTRGGEIVAGSESINPNEPIEIKWEGEIENPFGEGTLYGTPKVISFENAITKRSLI